jgi:GNAT superfamily N-acetyltransferase
MTNVIHVTSTQADGPSGPRSLSEPRWRVEVVRPHDGPVLAELFANCSPETVRLRFFGRLHALPAPYVEELLAGRPAAHDAVLAYPEPARPDVLAHPVGLGSLAAADTDEGPSAAAELGLLVTDAWQRRGAGAAMLDALFARARRRGVRQVSASVLPGRQALLGALARRLPTVGTVRATDALTGVYRLDAAG